MRNSFLEYKIRKKYKILIVCILLLLIILSFPLNVQADNKSTITVTGDLNKIENNETNPIDHNKNNFIHQEKKTIIHNYKTLPKAGEACPKPIVLIGYILLISTSVFYIKKIIIKINFYKNFANIFLH